MKKILFTILILTLVIASGCQPVETQEENTQTEDEIPDVSYDECIAGVKQANPEMSDADAKDNCLVIDAVNKQDKTLCDQVSADFKEDCLAAFE